MKFTYLAFGSLTKKFVTYWPGTMKNTLYMNNFYLYFKLQITIAISIIRITIASFYHLTSHINYNQFDEFMQPDPAATILTASSEFLREKRKERS